MGVVARRGMVAMGFGFEERERERERESWNCLIKSRRERELNNNF